MAQEKLIPGKKAVENKWIKNEDYQMTWYMIRDTSRVEIGKVSTQIIYANNQLIVVMQVVMKQSKSPWTDSTIADAKTLSPVYHSSQNSNRYMSLQFNNPVTGVYADKLKNTNTAISDTTREKYFDSNLYPALIRWLPLREGYKKDIAIYDYNPAGKTGVLKASVHEVKKGIYHSSLSGDHAVWIVSVSDEIGGGKNDQSIYFIDRSDRKLWKQEITAGSRKMMMVLTE
jgi:hypothetical protein